jgi:hypothetical protein
VAALPDLGIGKNIPAQPWIYFRLPTESHAVVMRCALVVRLLSETEVRRSKSSSIRKQKLGAKAMR